MHQLFKGVLNQHFIFLTSHFKFKVKVFFLSTLNNTAKLFKGRIQAIHTLYTHYNETSAQAFLIHVCISPANANDKL